MARRAPAGPEVHGILNVNKPAGWTSFAVVAYIRKRTRVRRVGHGGTLDPIGTGVLPIGLGQATRLLEYLLEGRKSYRVRIRLGISTTTYDAEGDPVFTADPSGITADDIQAVLPFFEGYFQQLPPLYSAIKHHGTPLYEYARAGEPVERQPRWVTVYRINLLAFDNPYFDLEVECGRGTYIRSIAHEIGERLGCGAHVAALVRTQVGPFRLEEAVAFDTLREALDRGDWQDYLLAPDSALLDWNAAILSLEKAHFLRQGRPVVVHPIKRNFQILPGHLCRVYDLEGRFVGIIRHEEGGLMWRPEKVFSPLTGTANP